MLNVYTNRAVPYFNLEPSLKQIWSGRADLNRRPLGPEPSALAKLSHFPYNILCGESANVLWRITTSRITYCVPNPPCVLAEATSRKRFRII